MRLCGVTFLLELELEGLMGTGILSGNEKARGGLIETMYEHRTLDVGIKLVEHSLKVGLREVLGWDGEETGRLVYDDDKIVLINDEMIIYDEMIHD